MKAAVGAGDVESFMATVSSDAVLRSPVSELAEFRGPIEMRELMRGVFDKISGIHYYEEIGDEHARVVFSCCMAVHLAKRRALRAGE